MHIFASKFIPNETSLMVAKYQEMHHALSLIKFQQKVLEILQFCTVYCLLKSGV